MDTKNNLTGGQISISTAAFGIAAAVAIIFNVLLVWVKETNPAVLAFMKQALYHHWITHGVAVLAVFLISGVVFAKVPAVKMMEGKKLAIILAIATVAGGLGIAGFYLFEL